jgi:DNA-binding SARP family transcriptional activator
LIHAANIHLLLGELTRLLSHPDRVAACEALIGEMRALVSAEESRGPRLRVTCFGAFRVAGQGDWDAGPQPRRARELLQYLVLHPKNSAPRERLVELFWPDQETEDVLHRLHLAASSVRTSLRRLLGGFDSLRCSGAGYSWHPALTIDSDVSTFSDLYRVGSIQACKDAVSLYAGELFSGEAGEWLQPVRVKYGAMYASMLGRIAQDAVVARNFEEGLHYGLEMLAADRAHEGASQVVMQCFAGLGRRNRAVSEYDALRAYLNKHLGVEPMRETRALLQTIMAHDD